MAAELSDPAAESCKSATMAGIDAASVTTSGGNKPSTLSLPDIPADQPLLHDAISTREKVDDILATKRLLGTTRGESRRCARLTSSTSRSTSCPTSMNPPMTTLHVLRHA